MARKIWKDLNGQSNRLDEVHAIAYDFSIGDAIGKLTTNNTDRTLVTEINVDDQDNTALIVAPIIAALGSGQRLIIRNADNDSRSSIYLITGTPTLSVSTHTIPVTYEDSSDTGTTDWESNDILIFSIFGGGMASMVEIGLAVSDELTNLTTGTAKLTIRMPHAMTLTEVRANVNTAPTGSVLTVDINESGATVLSTKLTIDATELTSTTAATPPVISDADLADDAEITIDIDGVGSTIAGKGLKVWLIGVRV